MCLVCLDLINWLIAVRSVQRHLKDGGDHVANLFRQCMCFQSRIWLGSHVGDHQRWIQSISVDWPLTVIMLEPL